MTRQAIVTQDRYFTIKEAVDFTGFSDTTIRRAFWAGALKGSQRRTGSGFGHIRIRESELVRWMDSLQG